MTLPKTLEELKAMKAVVKKMTKIVIQKNVSEFASYAADAESLLGKSAGAKILSFKKAIEAKASAKKAEKVAAAGAKVKALFDKWVEKIDAKVEKVKEA
jgi:hypothetical protein